ncbi:MAG: hypothetical protein IKQ41_12280 [Clostridia bacterium]|nr:hypothetical protein [Clostridia bacterium]
MRKALVFLLTVLALTLLTAGALAGEWVDDYLLTAGRDCFIVDFEEYALEHPGDYYVLYAVSGNPYFSRHKCGEGESAYTIYVAPGLKYEIELWYDPDQTGELPKWGKEDARKMRIPAAGPLDDFPYTLKDSTVGVRNVTVEEFTEYDVIPLSVLDQDDLEIRYRWAWDFEVKEKDSFSMVLQMTGPEGIIFVHSSTWSISPDDAHYAHWQQNMTDMMKQYTGQKNAALEGEFQLKVFINGEVFDELTFRMGQEGSQAEVSPEPAQETEQDGGQPEEPAPDITGLWKHTNTKILGIEVDPSLIPSEMYLDFRSDGTVTVTTIAQDIGRSVTENNWRMEGDQVLIDDMDTMYLEDDCLVMNMLGVSILYFERTDEPIPEPDKRKRTEEPEPTQEAESERSRADPLPDSADPADASEYYGTWKMVSMQINGSRRPSNTVRTYVISDGQAEEITLAGSRVFPVEFRDGELVMIAENSVGEQVELPFYLLSDGTLAQDMSAFYGASVIIFCEKQ